MAFNLKVEFLHQDKSGRVLIVRDSTGEWFDGYSEAGLPRDKVKAQKLTFSRIDSHSVCEVRHEGNDWTYGEPIRIDSSMFSKDINAAAYIFNDGVLDIGLYDEVDGMFNVAIKKGTNFIVGGTYEDSHDKDVVIVEGKYYEIDKTANTNNDTVLYIIGTFEDDATSFDYAYQANIKALLRSQAKNKLSLVNYDKMRATKAQQEMLLPDLYDAMSFSMCAKVFFEDMDYVSANDMIVASNDLLNKILR